MSAHDEAARGKGGKEVMSGISKRRGVDFGKKIKLLDTQSHFYLRSHSADNGICRVRGTKSVIFTDWCSSTFYHSNAIGFRPPSGNWPQYTFRKEPFI